MGFFNFIKNTFFPPGEGGTVDLKEWKYDKEELGVMIDLYAIFAVVQLKANLLANCELKTYKDGKEFKGLEWTRLNYKPNVNQSATEFWTEVYCKALYEEEGCLVFPVGDQLIIADGFSRDEYAVREQVFSNIYRGDFTYGRSLKMSEVIYLNFHNDSARMLKSGLLSRYNELITSASEAYKKIGGEKILLSVPAVATGDKKAEEDFKDLMNNRFKSFFKNKNSVVPLYRGIQGSFHAAASTGKEVEDIERLTKDAMKQAALAYGISPALVTGEVAGIKEALDWTLTVGIDPAANAVSEELTSKQFSFEKIKAGNFIFADTSNIKHIDIFDIAGNIDKLVACGWSHDDILGHIGLPKTNEEWAQRHHITKNYQDVNAPAEGGENNNG